MDLEQIKEADVNLRSRYLVCKKIPDPNKALDEYRISLRKFFGFRCKLALKYANSVRINL